jgi:hypothetical protein
LAQMTTRPSTVTLKSSAALTLTNFSALVR